jgi:hypothetical protein
MPKGSARFYEENEKIYRHNSEERRNASNLGLGKQADKRYADDGETDGDTKTPEFESRPGSGVFSATCE